MMPDRNAIKPGLLCYRCGASLAALSLPLARLDVCPGCGVELHVCRMCVHYAPSKPDACDEEDAVPVHNKTVANFCDWFVPSPEVFDGHEQRAESEARRKLSDLFGGAAESTGASSSGASASDASSSGAEKNPLLDAAEKLFRK